MFQFFLESTALCTARMIHGDEAVANWVFDQDYDPDFVSRHPNQLAGLFEATYDNE